MKTVCSCFFAAAAALASCSEIDSDPVFYSGTDTSTGRDIDSSTALDQGSDSAEVPAECPVNSGWPCACDVASVKVCQDESACVQVVLEGARGGDAFCSKSCGGREDLESCKDVGGFGLQGACVLQKNGKRIGDGIPSQCALVCEYQGATGSACPTGLECVPIQLRDPSVSFCL